MANLANTLRRLFHLYRLALFTLLSVAAIAQQAPESIPSIESLIRGRQYEQALQSIHATLRERPNDFRIWTLQGIVFSLQNNSREALAAFEQALSLSPNYVPALKAKVELLYRRGDRRAIPILQNLIKIDPKDEVAHEMLAVLEARAGNCTRAIGQFESSAKILASHSGSLELYGYCLQRMKQTEKAIAVFQQLAALVPEQTYPKYDLAVLLVETKQHAAALKVLESLLGSEQSDPDVLSLAADAYEGSGDTRKAVSHLRQAIVLSPKNASYYTAFALLCFDHESYEVGVDMLTVGLQQISDNSALFVSRGLLYAQLAQYDKAEADFKMAESIDSKQTLSSYAMDLADVEKDRPDLALVKVRAQLKVHPSSAHHHYLLAKLLERDASAGNEQRSKEAIAAALTAIKLNPGFLEARDLLASLYLSAGQYEPARQQCELALKTDPLDQAAIYHLIVVLRHSSSTADREQVRNLVKRLAEAQQVGRERVLNRKSFSLVEQPPGADTK